MDLNKEVNCQLIHEFVNKINNKLNELLNANKIQQNIIESNEVFKQNLHFIKNNILFETNNGLNALNNFENNFICNQGYPDYLTPGGVTLKISKI